MGKRGNRSRNRRFGRRDGGGRDGNTRENSPGRGSERSGKGGGSQKRRRSIPFDPEKHFLPDPVPEREYDPCPVSGEEIDDIFTAITDPQTGRPSRFDSVLEKLAAREELKEDERIAYIGRGAFGIVAMEKGENGRPRLVVRKRIEYETGQDTQPWRRELSPGISRDYVPKPEPLSELYSHDELRSFPRFESPIPGSSNRNN
ncbi:MAG: hypothetical protein ACOC2V_01880 [Alkalispirochaeta sp.]